MCFHVPVDSATAIRHKMVPCTYQCIFQQTCHIMILSHNSFMIKHKVIKITIFYVMLWILFFNEGEKIILTKSFESYLNHRQTQKQHRSAMCSALAIHCHVMHRFVIQALLQEPTLGSTPTYTSM